jgi:DNA-binding IclR family transcriptional regulator
VHQDRLHQAALPFLQALHRATGLTVHLAVLEMADVVYLEKIGNSMHGAITTRVGGRQPAHCTAVGKAILADTDDAAAVDLTARKTRFSIAAPAQLSAELSEWPSIVKSCCVGSAASAHRSETRAGWSPQYRYAGQ